MSIKINTTERIYETNFKNINRLDTQLWFVLKVFNRINREIKLYLTNIYSDFNITGDSYNSVPSQHFWYWSFDHTNPPNTNGIVCNDNSGSGK